MRSGKKAMMFEFIMFIVMVFLLTTAFFTLYKKQNKFPEDYWLGSRQYGLINTYQDAEKNLFYIDQSAKYSAYKTIYDLGRQGGFQKPGCGNYLNYNLWNPDKTDPKRCLPDYEGNFKDQFNENLNQHFWNNPQTSSLMDEYDFELNLDNKLTVIGLATKNLEKYVYLKGIKPKEKAYTVPFGAQEKIKKIARTYGAKIEQAIKIYDPENEFVDESLIVAMIAQESGGNPNAISITGCVGLMQFCIGTARDYESAFNNRLTKCYKESTKEMLEQAKCSQDNDARFDPGNSIKAGIQLIIKNMKTFREYADKEEFAVAAYNGGPSVIENAIRKISDEDPAWQEVQSQLTQDMIPYFEDVDRKEDKIKEIKDYVSRIMNYKAIYEELTKSGELEKIKAEGTEEPYDEDNPLVGTYSINASFKVNADYDLGEYEEVIKNAEQFYSCSEEQNLANCLNNKIKSINELNFLKSERDSQNNFLVWSLDCEEGEEKFLFDFAEQYKLCLDSNEESGVCEFEIPKGPKDKEIEIIISKSGDSLEFELEDSKIHYIIDGQDVLFVELEGDEFKNEKQDEIILNFDFDEEGKLEDAELKASGWFLSSDIEGKMKLYKETTNGKPVLYFIDPEDYSSFEVFSEDSEETKFKSYKPIKNTYTFCAKSNNKFYVYDDLSEKVELKNINYRFALKFTDKIAPEKIENLKIIDKSGDENSVLLIWDKNIAEDIKEYDIYYSKDNFENLDVQNLDDLSARQDQDIVIGKKTAYENQKTEIDDVDLEECNFKEKNKPCSYEIYDRALKKETLYYVDSLQKYVYALPGLDDNVDYNFAVVAVDHSGNKIKNDVYSDDENQKLEIKKGRSLDDLSPGFVVLSKEKSEKGKLKFSWEKEVKNIDGSVCDDCEAFNIYYADRDMGIDYMGEEFSLEEKDIEGNKILSKYNQKPIAIKELNCDLRCEYIINSQIESGKLYWFGITIIDSSGNEPDSVFMRQFGIS